MHCFTSFTSNRNRNAIILHAIIRAFALLESIDFHYEYLLKDQSKMLISAKRGRLYQRCQLRQILLLANKKGIINEKKVFY